MFFSTLMDEMERKVEDGRLEFIRADNHEFRIRDEACASELRRLIVWGGGVYNCGESELSKLVDAAAPGLECITYCPDATKGGALVRPKYHEGDRDGEVLFPQLTDMTIRLDPVVLPSDYGWIMPRLQRFRLLVVANHQLSTERAQRALGDWLGVRQRRGSTVPNHLLKACPELESITITLGSTMDDTQQQTDWLVLLPPKLLQWEIHRLLLLPLLGQSAPSDAESSPLGLLTLPLLDQVISFLGRRRWECHTETISSDVVEQYHLSPEFCQLPTSLLKELECGSGPQGGCKCSSAENVASVKPSKNGCGVWLRNMVPRRSS